MSEDMLCSAARGDLGRLLEGREVVHLPAKYCITDASDLLAYEAAVARHLDFVKHADRFLASRRQVTLERRQGAPLLGLPTPEAYMHDSQIMLARVSTADRATLRSALGALGDAERHALLPEVVVAMAVSCSELG